ncbi:MAG: hypothetical protein LBO02_02220 [Holosporaceae bacterium]|nr:hypothetical protein [Holosporaceae bacterium]
MSELLLRLRVVRKSANNLFARGESAKLLPTRIEEAKISEYYPARFFIIGEFCSAEDWRALISEPYPARSFVIGEFCSAD